MEQEREPRNEPKHVWSIYDKGAKNVQLGKRVFSINDVGKTVQSHAKE